MNQAPSNEKLVALKAQIDKAKTIVDYYKDVVERYSKMHDDSLKELAELLKEGETIKTKKETYIAFKVSEDEIVLRACDKEVAYTRYEKKPCL